MYIYIYQARSHAKIWKTIIGAKKHHERLEKIRAFQALEF